MKTSVGDHVSYWRTVAETLEQGTPLLESLRVAEAKASGTELRLATARLIREISAGMSLSAAMAPFETLFSPCVRAMVRAGEAGGVLEIVARRISEGLRAGAFPVAGTAADPHGEQARYWRAFGLLVSSGVPILQACDLVSQVVTCTALRDATAVLRDAIESGRSLSSAMLGLPDVFPDAVRAAIAVGERDGTLPEQVFRIVSALEINDLDSLVSDAERAAEAEKTAGGKAGIVQLVNELILDAVRQRASDIHLDATEDGRGRVRVRVDGMLREMTFPEHSSFEAVVSRFKIMAAMNIAEHRLPQDGRIMLEVEGKRLDLRVSVVSAMFGERVVARILDRQQVKLGLPDVGLEGEDLAQVRRLATLPNGMVLVTGPVGAGKTTLLYGMLREVNREACCVMTVEHPVEYTIEGVAQLELRPAIGVTYPRLLRHVLRQDPDVVMVSELRDLETIEMAAQCALTGHLLLSTLHANTAAGAIERLLVCGLEPFLLSATLAGVVAQRLVRTLCATCKQPVTPAAHTMPPEGLELLETDVAASFFRPVGCDECRGTGYRGRTAIHEMILMNDRLRPLLTGAPDRAELQRVAIETGMKTLRSNGMAKAARGVTSIDEILRVTPADRTR